MLKNETPSNQASVRGQQNIQLPIELQQQITALNAHINSVNFAYSDLIRELETTLKLLIGQNAALSKKNAELKTPKKEDSEPKPEKQSKA
jgi:hypothetical protein